MSEASTQGAAGALPEVKQVVGVSEAVPPAAPAKPKVWTSSIHLAHTESLPTDFVDAIRSLEILLGMNIVLFVQQGLQDLQGRPFPFETIDAEIVDKMGPLVRGLPKDKPIGLLLHSPGGYARDAFIIARLFHRHCQGFTAIVPKYAKSAATLLALGADRILMHTDAEMGPLDAQVLDLERERRASALDEVQSLERLHAEALSLIDSTMMLLIGRAGKRTDIILPHALKYVAETMRPLFEKIDTVHFTAMSRTLKVGETYAERLLSRRYPDVAEKVARGLVYDYPDHNFVIDFDECRRIGLNAELMKPAACEIVESIFDKLEEFTAIGLIHEDVELK